MGCRVYLGMTCWMMAWLSSHTMSPVHNELRGASIGIDDPKAGL